MKRIIQRSNVTFNRSQPNISECEDGDQEVMEGVVGDKVLLIVGVGYLVGCKSNESDYFTQCFIFGCFHK